MNRGYRPAAASFAGFLSLCCVFLITACAPAEDGNSQTADQQWSPSVSSPEFPPGQGPRVLIDAAHGNFHTMEGRYAAFAELLTLDGYRVRSAATPVTAELLEQADVFVVSNAIYGGDDADWSLPATSAFTAEEIVMIVEWVRNGGSLFLIADHMPFPGSTAELASEFGVIFLDGFAMKSMERGETLTFTRDAGSLASHPITQGRSESETVHAVTSFTGQAFRFVGDVQPLMHMPEDWVVLLPTEAWVFDTGTPYVSARGLIQGGVLHFGGGRLAVFGEAAMFTAQTSVQNGIVSQMGMNHPAATDNPQFLLNVLHWLTGQLDD